MSKTTTLIAYDLIKSYSGRRVIDGITVIASSGQRIGIIGENGVGKSTLLRLLAGVEEPDAGKLQHPQDYGYLRQKLPFPSEATVQDVIDDALSELRAVQARLDKLTIRMQEHPDDTKVVTEYGDLLAWAESHDLWGADRRAEIVCIGLGLANVESSRPLETLSGGERSRLGLAALLIRQPQAMLLDEPTNHLDDDAVSFLEQQLNKLPGTVVLASHDRVFLDEVCTDIMDLDPSREGVTRYGGAYTDYLESKRLERIRWEQQFSAEQERLRELRRSVDVTARSVNHARAIKDNNKLAYDRAGGRVQRQISRRVRNAQNRLDELKRTQVRKPPEPLCFAAALTKKLGSDRICVSLRSVHLAERLSIKSLDIETSTRLMITGPNGAGKSTLLKVLAGREIPDSGEVWWDKNVRCDLLEQEVSFHDNLRSPRQLYDQVAGAYSIPMAQLGLLPLSELDRPVGQLSLGQQRRVALALLIAHPPDILLLDEPTNHLSLALVEELEDAFRTAPGAVVVATHDRWLRRRWEGEEVSLIGGRAAI